MHSKKPDVAVARRRFLKGVAAAGGATALTSVFASRLFAVDAGGTAVRKDEQPVPSRGYHETDHIREYYRTLRA